MQSFQGLAWQVCGFAVSAAISQMAECGAERATAARRLGSGPGHQARQVFETRAAAGAVVALWEEEWSGLASQIADFSLADNKIGYALHMVQMQMHSLGAG